MSWLFAVMPWHSAHYPSLSAGILKAVAQEYDEGMQVDVLYGNIRWIDYLKKKTKNQVDLSDYHIIGEDLIFKGTGEWIFSTALHQCEEWKSEEYRTTSGLSDEHFKLAHEQHLLARGFIYELAEEIVAKGYKYIGLTSTFMQNTACLALAKRLKQLAPYIKIIMGGGNCDGPQGLVIHKNFTAIDYVVSGEGEAAFRAFLRYCNGDLHVEKVPNLIWRDHNGVTRSNSAAALSQMSDVPIPLYDDYFEQALSSDVADGIELNLVVESARGCWWGQKHHCTFCGLNGTGMKYRQKDANAFVEEIEILVSRHQTLDIITADNIIGMDYFKTVFPILKDRDLDLRIHYEVKANLRYDQLLTLRDANICHLQPGIESLSSKILKQMAKGTTGVQNVRVLRDITELGITATWNILAGFPEETYQDYETLMQQLPALVHIQPPTGIGRIAVERFSPYFNDPLLGFQHKRPARYYQTTFDLPEEELANMVYLFDSEQLGITDEHMKDIQSKLEDWSDAYQAGSLLSFETVVKGILIRDNRRGWPRKSYLIDDALEQLILNSLRLPKSRTALYSLAQKASRSFNEVLVDKVIKKLQSRGLIFKDDNCFVALPTDQAAIQIRIYGDESELMQSSNINVS